MERNVTGPDGRQWVVRSFRFRRPPWRPVDPSFGLGVLDPDESLLIALPALLLYVVLAPFALLVVPLVVFLLEAPARVLWSLASTRRWVEAVHAGQARSSMTWTTDTDHVEAVVDQVARQLELGYERITPHRARFMGFSR